MKKFLSYILIFVVLVGLFGPMGKASALNAVTPTTITNGAVDNPAPVKVESTADNEFQRQIDNGCAGLTTWTIKGCLLKLFYYTYFMLPTFVLWLSAQFFNVLMPISLDSTITIQSEFIPQAWGVVRDISNIFFIFILLYVAVQTILGMGHETKKMIVQVVLMALLINFSMFFTKVVIDSSNILALIFYNKLDARTGTTPSNNERDITGAMYKNFDATTLLTKDTIEKIKHPKVGGKTITENEAMPFGPTMGIMFIAGTIMLFAAYVFFVAGFSFLGRLIELWILIIFSPFAFMSSTLPILSGINYIGWKNWMERLLATSFMAPIFMFLLYFIFLLLPHTASFVHGDGIVSIMLSVLIPALLILALLLKAVSFAKKGGGYFGELTTKGATLAGGLALGAATGGVAMGLRGTMGKHYTNIANDDKLKRQASGLEGTKKEQATAQKRLALANAYANSSFDFRQTGFGKFAEKASGMNLSKGLTALKLDTKSMEGGYQATEKHKAEEEEKKQETYKMTGVAAEKQDAEAAVSQKEYKNARDRAEKEIGKEKFNEEEFKIQYGTEKIIKTSKQINEDRKASYIESQKKKGEEELKDGKRKGMLRRFGSDFKAGANPAEQGIIRKAVIGTVTLGAAPVIQGLASAIRGLTSAHATDAEVLAKLRSKKSTDQQILDLLKKKEEEGKTTPPPIPSISKPHPIPEQTPNSPVKPPHVEPNKGGGAPHASGH